MVSCSWPLRSARRVVQILVLAALMLLALPGAFACGGGSSDPLDEIRKVVPGTAGQPVLAFVYSDP